MYFKATLLSSIIFFAYSVCISQSNYSLFIPDHDYRAPKKVLRTIDSTLKMQTGFSKKHSTPFIKKIPENFTTLEKGSYLMYTDTLSQYLRGIVQNILVKNHLSTNKYFVFTYRDPMPNASNLSSGVILIHLGLLPKLSNESEIAFIICHEIAHNIKNHVIDGINKKAELLNSKNVEQEMKKIK